MEPPIPALGGPELETAQVESGAAQISAPERPERIVELMPVPRVVGPGRRERAYLEQIALLESAARTREAELVAAALVERGSTRRLDRMERKLEAVREAAIASEQREKRLILALGALQRENELLRERTRVLELGSKAPAARALPAPRPPMKRSLLARLFRRA